MNRIKNMRKPLCTHHKCSAGIFCTEADTELQREFFKEEMLSSMRKHWEYEEKFRRITDSYINARPTHQFISKKDREYRAANDPARKAAGANAQYHMARATMYANALNSLS